MVMCLNKITAEYFAKTAFTDALKEEQGQQNLYNQDYDDIEACKINSVVKQTQADRLSFQQIQCALEAEK